MAKRNKDTTVPPIAGTFEDAVRAMLATPAPPKNLGRSTAKRGLKKHAKQQGGKKR